MNESILKVTRVDVFASDNVSANNQGMMAIIPAGKVTYVDLKMLDDNFLTGGILRTLNTQFGDYVDLQVVDVDNILRAGNNIVLAQYCTSWYLRSDSQEQLNETINYPAKVLSGLYLRLVYHSVGLENVTVTVNYRLHKALY